MEGCGRADNAGDELSGGKLRQIISRAVPCPSGTSLVCHAEPAERMRGRVEGSRRCFFAGVIQAEQACEENSPPKSCGARCFDFAYRGEDSGVLAGLWRHENSSGASGAFLFAAG